LSLSPDKLANLEQEIHDHIANRDRDYIEIPNLRSRRARAVVGLRPSFSAMYPDFLQAAPPTPACASFIKESRMKRANASKLNRKSGVRWGEHGAPVAMLQTSLHGSNGEPAIVNG
jgi:hypothetical protein